MHQRDYVPEGEIGYRALATQPSVRRAALIARFHSGCHTLRQFARPVAHPSVTRPRGDGCLRRLRGRRPALVMSGGSPVRCSDTKASQRFPQVGHTSGVFARWPRDHPAGRSVATPRGGPSARPSCGPTCWRRVRRMSRWRSRLPSRAPGMRARAGTRRRPRGRDVRTWRHPRLARDVQGPAPRGWTSSQEVWRL